MIQKSTSSSESPLSGRKESDMEHAVEKMPTGSSDKESKENFEKSNLSSESLIQKSTSSSESPLSGRKRSKSEHEEFDEGDGGTGRDSEDAGSEDESSESPLSGSKRSKSEQEEFDEGDGGTGWDSEDAGSEDGGDGGTGSVSVDAGSEDPTKDGYRYNLAELSKRFGFTFVGALPGTKDEVYSPHDDAGSETEVDKAEYGDDPCDYPDESDDDYEYDKGDGLDNPNIPAKPYSKWTPEDHVRLVPKRTIAEEKIYRRIVRRTRYYEAPSFGFKDPGWSPVHPLRFEEVHGELEDKLQQYSQKTIDRYNQATDAKLRLKYVIKATGDLETYYVTAALIDDASKPYVGRFCVHLIRPLLPPLPDAHVGKMQVTRGKYVPPTWEDYTCPVNEIYRQKLPDLEQKWIAEEEARNANAMHL